LADRRQRWWLRRFYALLTAGLIDMDFAAVRRNVTLVTVLAFELVIAFVWWSEFTDLPHILGAPPSPFSWQRPLVTTLWILILLYLFNAVVCVLFKQIRYLEGFLPVCSFCKSIRVGDKWVPLERYLQEHTSVRMTHSLCPPCAKQHYEYEEEAAPL
jgi:hypothetical protein